MNVEGGARNNNIKNTKNVNNSDGNDRTAWNISNPKKNAIHQIHFDLTPKIDHRKSVGSLRFRDET